MLIQPLEARDVPAIFTVSNLNDSGGGSLRQAILDANGSGGQDSINFQAGVAGTIPLASGLTITDSLIINGPGAAVLSVSGQNSVRPFFISNFNSTVIDVLIFDMTVTAGNSDIDGGGFFIDSESVRLDRVIVSNCVTDESGGGIYVNGSGALFLQDSTITGNTATGGVTNRGGGVYFFNGGILNMQGCALVGNSATGANGGGGLYFYGATSASSGGVTVSNCTFFNNTAPMGGGIALRNVITAANPVTIQNNTITGNISTTTSTAAGYGGGGLSVVSGAGVNVVVRSNILSGNTATNGRPDIASSPELLFNNNAIGVFTGANQKPGSGSNLIGQNLLLNSLGNNGGLTQTISFASNSPLRNAGSNLGGLATDQRGAGFPRIIDGVPDIGAFELPMITVKNLNDSGAGSLRQAILDSNGSTSAAETIVFQSGLTGTINLGSQLLISDDLIITGPGASVISVSGQDAVRVFDVTDSNNSTTIGVTISGLTVTAGRDGPFSSNVKGGGIRIANETVTLDSVVVSNCAAVVPSFSEGGGIFVGVNGHLTVRNSTITGNSAVEIGGGIAVYGGGFGFTAGSNLLIENSTVSNNTSSQSGGGIVFIGDVGPGGVTIRNSTIAGNTAVDGGGLQLRSLDTNLGGVLIQNSTFTGNRATTTSTLFSGEGGGGIQLTDLNPYAVTISSTIVAENTAANGRDDITAESGVTLNVSNSAIGDPDGFTINGTNSNNLPIGTPLGLLPLANNGGPTQTVAFAANSPLLNAGSNPANLTTDGRGFPRVANGTADIGAFEATVFTVTNLNDDGLSGSLRLAVQVANLTVDPEVIVFQPGLTGTIFLGSTLPITRSVSIASPLTSAVSISGQGVRRVLTIDDGNFSVINVTIAGLGITSGNSNTVGRGGGLFIGNENVLLDRMTVANNVGVQGGGIAVDDDGRLTVRNSTIAVNSTSFGGGGGIHFNSNGSLLLENSTVSENTATGHGGGISFNSSVGPGGFTVRNSTISGNMAADGGGIGFYYSPTPTVPILIQNSTITNNNATTSQTGAGRGGGGISLRGPNTGTVNIVSTIVSGNSATNGRGDIASQASQPNINFSAIGDPDGFTRSGTSDNNLPDGTTLGLGALQNNGGLTSTHLPATNSPVVGQGSNPAGLVNDQRGFGFGRSRSASVDIGAVEARTQLLVNNTNDSGIGSLRQAIIEANAWGGADTVTFDPAAFGSSTTITLSTGQILITDAVAVQGPGAQLATVNANKTSRVFELNLTSGGVDISGLTVTGGNASNGAAFLLGDDSLTLTDMAITGNTAFNDGGAIHITGGGTLTLRRCTFSGNSAQWGGAVSTYNSGGTLIFENSTISGNSATNNGGGIYFSGTSGTGITVRNSTITNNTAGSGGGIFRTSGSTPGITLESSFVSGNNSGSGPDINASGFTVTANFSAVGSNAGFTGLSGTGNLAFGANLLLGTLGDFGGPTQTIPLLPGSAAINAGSTADPTDQRGLGRVGTPDIGAFESQGFVLTPSGSGQSTKINTAFANPLKVAVTASNAVEPVNGGMIAFVPPFSGASASLSPLIATIAGGSASTTATANGTVGSYNVTAFANVTNAVQFELTNTNAAPLAKVSTVVVGDGTNQRSHVAQLKVTFDSAITFSGTPAAAFELARNKDSQAVNLAVSMDVTNTTATLTFTGGAVDGNSLADGIYTLKVLANQIAGGGLDGNADGNGGDNYSLVGNPASAPKLFRLFGDADGNGTVSAADFNAFRLVYGSAGSSIFDFDGNSQVSASDFNQFRTRYGVTLVP